MDRAIVFIVLAMIAGSDACRPPPCHWTDAKPIEDYFSQVAQQVIHADRDAQNFCNQHGSSQITEIHTLKYYRLKMPASGVTQFEVKVRDRVLLVRTVNCQGSLNDVRILPAYVNPSGGSYTVYDDELLITFPYKFDPGVGGGSCSPPAHDTVTIPAGYCDDCHTHNRIGK